MKSNIKQKRKPRKTYKKKGKKQLKYKQKRRTFRKRKTHKQKGGFIIPFVDAGKSVWRNGEYQFKTMRDSYNPPPYAAPSNPTSVVNPHPAYDQYTASNGKMIDPENILGSRLPEAFNKSIISTKKF